MKLFEDIANKFASLAARADAANGEPQVSRLLRPSS